MRGRGLEQLENTLMNYLKNTPNSQIATPAPKTSAVGRQDGACHKRLGIHNVFTPCVVVPSLLKNFHSTAKSALPGYVIVFSPACSSFDQFGKNQGTEELRTRSGEALAPTIGGGFNKIYPHMQTVAKKQQPQKDVNKKNLRFAPGFFEEKTRRKINNPQTIPQYERTLSSANDQ
jgi:hypothetical protein